jgi:hypothetical protein
MSDQQWQEHDHEAAVHNHRHYHVTHNFSEVAGTFQHLSSEHDHDHDHASLSHAHYPHENFDQEHQGEAHVHDHEEPVRSSAARKASGTRKTADAPAGNGEGQPAKAGRTTKRTAKASS